MGCQKCDSLKDWGISESGREDAARIVVFLRTDPYLETQDQDISAYLSLFGHNFMEVQS